MANQYGIMTPPASPAISVSASASGVIYRCAAGQGLSVPEGDVASLQAAGWTLVAYTGAGGGGSSSAAALPTVIAVSSSRALLSSDNGNVLECSTTLTLTLPAGLPANFICTIIPIGSVTVNCSGGATINGASSLVVAGTGVSAFTLVSRAAGGNAYEMLGGNDAGFESLPLPVGGVLLPEHMLTNSSSSAQPSTLITCYTPFVVPRPTTLIAMHVNLITAQTGAAARLGIYSDANSRPGALMVDAGELDLSSGTGIKSLTISLAVPPGRYWACYANKPATTGPTVLRVNTTKPNGLVPTDTADLAVTSGRRGLSSTAGSYGALASTALSPLTEDGTNPIPTIGIGTSG